MAAVAIGGAIGGGARYGVGRLLAESSAASPWTTFAVNVLGTLLLGWFLAWSVRRRRERGHAASHRIPLVATGVLGSFTTFSTFVLDATELASAGHVVASVAYAGGSVALGLAAAAVGLRIGGGPAGGAPTGAKATRP
ncbi:MAG: CrcB family protein [Trueperaceae bacterium]